MSISDLSKDGVLLFRPQILSGFQLLPRSLSHKEEEGQEGVVVQIDQGNDGRNRMLNLRDGGERDERPPIAHYSCLIDSCLIAVSNNRA
jgi:hypothetical protein